MIARFSRIGARIWVGSPFRLSLEGLTGSQEASGAPPRSLGSSCTDGCHYAGTPLFGCRIGVPPKSPLLLVQGSSHASCAMCCVYAPFVFIYSSNVDTTSRFTRTYRNPLVPPSPPRAQGSSRCCGATPRRPLSWMSHESVDQAGTCRTSSMGSRKFHRLAPAVHNARRSRWPPAQTCTGCC